MNVAVLGENIPQVLPRQDVAQRKHERERLAQIKETAIEHFKEVMPDGKLSAETLEMFRELQQSPLSLGRKLQFIIDNQSKQILIKVIDAGTGKMIKILPPKELQHVSRRSKGAAGLLLDETA
ncbi:MAG: flagellar protein FlaG [Spirochaetaceae bacterium]|jgi:uncharacterized FlaG/YvyC family protein|nr:flagellar protein FlaG [Spirochaetaceae bacterium]